MREIEFLYDFGSPNAWFVHRAIPAYAARGTVTFRYVPVLPFQSRLIFLARLHLWTSVGPS
jgi:2-hydroxychromene-2-carboxylate isomerase